MWDMKVMPAAPGKVTRQGGPMPRPRQRERLCGRYVVPVHEVRQCLPAAPPALVLPKGLKIKNFTWVNIKILPLVWHSLT